MTGTQATLGSRQRARRIIVKAGTDRVVQAGLALILVQLVIRGWMVFGSWFHIDDFNYVARMIHQGPSLSTAAEPYFGHSRPGGLYLSWLNHVIAPWDWRLAATEILLFQLIASLTLLRLLLHLFGPRLAILPGLAVYLFCPLSVPSSLWWVSAESYLPFVIAIFLASTSHLFYLRTGRVSHAWAAAGWIVAGLLFNEKAILTFGLLGLITLFWFTRGTLSERVRQALTTYRAGFVLYVVIGAVYTSFYISQDLSAEYGARRADVSLGDILANMVGHAFLPAIWGGPLQWKHFAGEAESVPAPGSILMLLAVGLTVLLVRELHLTRRGYVRALALPAFFLAIDIGLVLGTRASFVGAEISLNFRYQAELPAVVAIALPAAIVPILRCQDPLKIIRGSELFDHPSRVVVATAVVSVLGVISSAGYALHWNAFDKPKRYVERLTAALDSRTTPADVVDGAVPSYVTHGFHYPENSLSHLFGDRPDALRFPETATDELYVVDPRGELSPAVIPPVRSAPPGPRKRCGYRIGEKGRTLPLTGPVAYGGWWVRIGYLSTAGSPVVISTGKVSHRARIEPGVHALYVAGAGSFDQVRISGIQGNAELCTDDVTVGRPQAAGVDISGN